MSNVPQDDLGQEQRNDHAFVTWSPRGLDKGSLLGVSGAEGDIEASGSLALRFRRFSGFDSDLLDKLLP